MHVRHRYVCWTGMCVAQVRMRHKCTSDKCVLDRCTCSTGVYVGQVCMWHRCTCGTGARVVSDRYTSGTGTCLAQVHGRHRCAGSWGRGRPAVPEVEARSSPDAASPHTGPWRPGSSQSSRRERASRAQPCRDPSSAPLTNALGLSHTSAHTAAATAPQWAPWEPAQRTSTRVRQRTRLHGSSPHGSPQHLRPPHRS